MAVVLGRSCLAGVGLSLWLAGCAPVPPPTVPDRLDLTPAAFTDLPGWADDRVAQALPALARSCERLSSLPADRPVGPAGEGGGGAGIGGTAGDWAAPCRALGAVPPGDDAAARAYLTRWFVPHATANNGADEGLFTGYYEASLRGSSKPGPGYGVPLYRRPPELVTVDLGAFSEKWKGERTAGRVVDGRLIPYADRAAIVGGALAGRGLELLWVSDPVDAFFLQIQGSGRVALPDGREMRVGYAGQNGHRYVAIGRELIARGALTREGVSMAAIRAWLAAHPAEAAGVMNANPSYVFFTELTGDGPLGAQGVALTPGRSLAVDRAFLPYGAPVWLDAEAPVAGEARVRRLLVAQDTGGAIRGPVRGDVFWGHGAEAERLAGAMKSRGRAWILLPAGRSKGAAS